MSRRVVGAVVALIGLLAMGLSAATPAAADDTGPVPFLHCVTYDPAYDEVTAYFGYANYGPSVEMSPENDYFDPSPLYRGQPLTFTSGGYHSDVFSVTWGLSQYPSITWNLNGTSVTASKDSESCIHYVDAWVKLDPSATSVAVGDTVSYSLYGSFLTAAVSLPPGLTFVSADDVCTGTTTLTCSAGATIVARATEPGDVTATATVKTASGPDPDPSDNTVSATVRVSGAPIPVTGPSTAVTGRSATLTGTVNPQGAASTYTFSYWRQAHADQVTTTSTANVTAGMQPVPVRGDVSGLYPNTTYEFVLSASNANGSATGETGSFTTTAESADLQLAMKADTDAVSVGDEVTYTMTVTNAGPDDATGVTVTDPLPGAATLTSSSDCIGTDTLTCSIGDLASGSSATVTATVKLGSAGTAVNTVTVAADQADPHVADNTASTRVTVAAPPTVVVGSPSAVSSTEATVSGVVNPNGSGTTYAVNYGTTTAYGTSVGGGVISSGTSGVPVSVRLPGLTPATTYRAQLVATNAAGTTRSSDVTFRTLPAADIAVTVAAPKSGSLGKPVTVTVTVRNTERGIASQVRVTLPRPAAAALRSLSASQGSCSPGSNPPACTLGPLPRNTKATVRVTYTPQSAGPLAVSATATALNVDGNPANNTGKATIRVK